MSKPRPYFHTKEGLFFRRYRGGVEVYFKGDAKSVSPCSIWGHTIWLDAATWASVITEVSPKPDGETFENAERLHAGDI